MGQNDWAKPSVGWAKPVIHGTHPHCRQWHQNKLLKTLKGCFRCDTEQDGAYLVPMWGALAQWLEHRGPGFESSCCRFKSWAILFRPCCLCCSTLIYKNFPLRLKIPYLWTSIDCCLTVLRKIQLFVWLNTFVYIAKQYYKVDKLCEIAVFIYLWPMFILLLRKLDLDSTKYGNILEKIISYHYTNLNGIRL